LMMTEVIAVSESRPKLCELDWFDGIYRKIFDVLSVEDMLPSPCQITVLYPGDVETRETVYGAAWRNEKIIWFRVQPPDPVDFAHELLHLIYIPNKVRELEEVYSYNLAGLVVTLARENIIPEVSVIRLFDVTEDDILMALRKVYNIRFNSIEEYFEFIGVIPPFIRLQEGMNGTLRFVRSQEYSSRHIVIYVVTELAAGADFDPLMFQTILELLNYC